MYKFEIHRNPNKSTDGQFVDTERYNESGYVFERTINPIYDSLAFKWEKENNRVFFRKKLDGRFSLIGVDFDWINEIRTDSDARNEYRILIIYEKIDSVWTNVWRGFFSVIVGEWDLNNCVVGFSKLIVWDDYNRYLENLEEERNFIDIYPLTIVQELTDYEWESTSRVLDTDIYDPYAPCDFDLQIISSDEFFIEDKYVMYSRSIVPDFFGSNWIVSAEYRRNWVIQVNSPGVDWQDLGVDPANPGGDEHKYVRNYLGLSSPSYVSQTVYVWVAENRSCEVINYHINETLAPGFDDYDNNRARFFHFVVNYAMIGVPTNFGYGSTSTFLTASTNPVTGLTNEMDLLWMIQFTDVHETSDPATRAMYSFKDVEEWLGIINLFWYIDSNGIRIEHEKFFDQGLSYDENSVGIDILSDENWVKQAKATSKFSYITEKIPRIHELKMAYESGDDFFGAPIIYNGSMVDWGEESKSSVSVDNMATDLRGAVLNNDTGKDGFMLVATNFEDLKYRVINGTGALTGQSIANAPLCIANIEESFWRWNNHSPFGVMNNKFTTFDNVRNNFAQEDFTINYCEELDPYKLVRTEYGEGRIEVASLTLKDKQLTLSLSYQ